MLLVVRSAISLPPSQKANAEARAITRSGEDGPLIVTYVRLLLWGPLGRARSTDAPSAPNSAARPAAHPE